MTGGVLASPYKRRNRKPLCFTGLKVLRESPDESEKKKRFQSGLKAATRLPVKARGNGTASGRRFAHKSLDRNLSGFTRSQRETGRLPRLPGTTSWRQLYNEEKA